MIMIMFVIIDHGDGHGGGDGNYLQGLLRLYSVQVESQVLLRVRVAVRTKAGLEVCRGQGGRLERLSCFVPLRGILQQLQHPLHR